MDNKKRRTESDDYSIEKFSISETSQEVLKKRGILNLFPIQAKSYEWIYNKHDVLGKARTGTGKTLAFVLPTIEIMLKKNKFDLRKFGRYPQVLALLPTRELAQQVADEFCQFQENRYKVSSIYGGTPEYGQIQDIKKGVDILVGCPGRVIDFLDRKILNLCDITVLILDEADKMLEMGFKENVDRIIDTLQVSTLENAEKFDKENKKFQILLFSATVPLWVKNIVNNIMSKDSITVDVTKEMINGQEVESKSRIRHLAIQCAFPQRQGLLRDIITMYGGIHGKCIIFTETKQAANEISMRSNISEMCQVLHGDIQQNQREIALQAFKEGKYRCLVATDVAARGLHIDDVSVVIQLAPPRDIDTYVHRAGRTGRAGKSGTAILFCNMSDYPFLSGIEKSINISFQRIGVPQYQEIIQKAADSIGNSLLETKLPANIVESLYSPAKSIIENMWIMMKSDKLEKTGFKRSHKQLDDVDKEGLPNIPECAIRTVCLCLIELSGFNENNNIVHRSVLNGRENFKSYIIKFLKLKEKINSNGYIWRSLKTHFSGNEDLVEKIQSVTLLKDGSGAIFDIPYENALEWDKLMVSKGKSNYIEINIADSNLPELSMPSLNYEENHGNNRINSQHISNRVGFRNSRGGSGGGYKNNSGGPNRGVRSSDSNYSHHGNVRGRGRGRH